MLAVITYRRSQPYDLGIAFQHCPEGFFLLMGFDGCTRFDVETLTNASVMAFGRGVGDMMSFTEQGMITLSSKKCVSLTRSISTRATARSVLNTPDLA